jgi:voltage-gated potassium channel Kch
VRIKVASKLVESCEKRVVVGLGATGLSCARYLYQRGLPFAVVDTRAQPPGLDELRCEMPDVEFFAGDYPAEIVTSATELIALLSLSFLKSRTDVLRLIGFTAVLLVLPLSLASCIAFTEVGNAMFGNWFGLSPAGRTQAQAAVAVLICSAPVLLLRGTAFALLMLNRRTIIITYSTLIRLLTLGVSLVFLPRWLEGAAVGAAGSSCTTGSGCSSRCSWFPWHRVGLAQAAATWDHRRVRAAVNVT